MPSFSKLLSVALVTLAATSSVSGSGLRVRDDCPRGQEWNGRECVHQPSADDCSRGQEWNGRECVDKKVEPSADSCGRDQEWNGRECVDKKVEPSADSCGRDKEWNGRACVDKKVECGRGQVDDGRGGCVDKKVECGRGQVDDGRGGCVDKVEKVECRIGQVLERGKCVDKVEKVECRIGQVLERGKCVDIPVVDTRKPGPPPAPAGPTDEEIAEAVRVAAMKKHTDKVACNKKCKSDHAKPVCAKGKAGKACRKDKSWKDKKAMCLAGCKA